MQTVQAACTAADRWQGLDQEDGDPLALHNINRVSSALDKIRKHNGIKCEPMPDPVEILKQAYADVSAMLNVTRRGQVRSEDA